MGGGVGCLRFQGAVLCAFTTLLMSFPSCCYLSLSGLHSAWVLAYCVQHNAVTLASPCTSSLHAVLTVASPTPPPPAHLYPCMQVHCGCTSSSLSLSSGSCPEWTAPVLYHTPPLIVFVSAQLAPRADGLEMTCTCKRVPPWIMMSSNHRAKANPPRTLLFSAVRQCHPGCPPCAHGYPILLSLHGEGEFNVSSPGQP